MFATDLPYPTSMQLADDGSLLVLTNAPTAGLFDSTGEIVRLVDADDDGVADGPPTTLYTGLPGIATSMRRVADLVFVSSRALDDETISLLRLGSSPGDPLTLLGEIELVYPAPAELPNHRNVALAARPTPGGGTIDLVFNVGSEENATATSDVIAGQGLLAGVPGAAAMPMDSVWLVRVTDGGGIPVLSDLTRIAGGLRNASGLAFGDDGSLWLAENGIDPTGSSDQSADELNRIDATDFATTVPDFGFPSDYVDYATGVPSTGLAAQPEVSWLRTPDLVTGAKSEGPVEIAFAPAAFPAAFQGGIFTGFHGRFSAAGTDNDENPVVFTDRSSGAYFHFVPNTEAALGHPNGLLATPRSLFIADLTSTGNPFSSGANGVIHQIQSVAAVPVLGGTPWIWMALAAIAAAAAAGRSPRVRLANRAGR